MQGCFNDYSTITESISDKQLQDRLENFGMVHIFLETLNKIRGIKVNTRFSWKFYGQTDLCVEQSAFITWNKIFKSETPNSCFARTWSFLLFWCDQVWRNISHMPPISRWFDLSDACHFHTLTSSMLDCNLKCDNLHNTPRTKTVLPPFCPSLSRLENLNNKPNPL